MTDAREALDEIKKNLRDADRDAFMGNLSHQARTEIPRLTEALEAVLEMDGPEYMIHRIRAAIEAKLSEEES